jgi:hypothetical protein
LHLLHKKQTLDWNEKAKYEQELRLLEHRKSTLQTDITNCEEQIKKSQDYYKKIINEQSQELETFYQTHKAQRMAQLNSEMTTARELMNERLTAETNRCNAAIEKEQQHLVALQEEYKQEIDELAQKTLFEQERFENLLAPLKQYEMEQQARLYYTVQVPIEYRDDISYLLTTVAQRVKHPDIISKLVWAEYIKPNIDETFKRIGVEDKPGIYKLTNIDSGKSYVGKSTNVKKRIQDHFKSSVGITSIADQAVHHAMLETGLWNWSIEVIQYCDKEQLNELEKYYIEFFKSQEFGYNKTGGG